MSRVLLWVQVTWNKNGNWLVSCSRDQTIKLYDIRTMKDMATFKASLVCDAERHHRAAVVERTLTVSTVRCLPKLVVREALLPYGVVINLVALGFSIHEALDSDLLVVIAGHV